MPSPPDPRPPARWRSPWHRVPDTAIGVAAVLILLAIVGGIPAALVRFVGWPLPTSVPTIDTISAALRHGQIAAGTLLKLLAVIVWVTWSLMVTGILVEFVALVRGTVARPTIGALQRLASRLLTTAMLLSTLTARPAVAATSPPTPVSVVTSAQEVTPAVADDSREDAATWVVRRRDSLWTIAERTLGDGHRWREIRDLNVGRGQPDGGRLQPDDTTIHPGWVLRLPDAAKAEAAKAEDRQREITVEPGDHLWGLAEEHLGDGARWRQLYRRNEGAMQADDERLTRPGLIRPGWVLQLPQDRASPRSGVSGDRGGRQAPRSQINRKPEASSDQDGRGRQRLHDVPVAPLPVTPSTLPDERDRPAQAESTAKRQATGAASQRPVVATSERQPEDDMRPTAGVALLASGLIAAIALRRRRWLRHRRPGSALAPADPEVAELERWLRAMADHDVNQRTHRVLRLLTEHFDAHDVRPEVYALELGEHVSLLLSEAATSAPPAITVADDGHTWVLGAELEVAAPRDDGRPPLIPALVVCGSRPTGAIVALNLLHLGVLEISGPPQQVQAALASWTAELASGGAADGVELIVVGPHHHQVEQFARVTIAEDAQAAIARADRALADGDATGPPYVIVLSAAPSTDPAWQTLRRRAADDLRLALVSPGDGGADHHLRIDGDHVRFDPPGLDVLAPEWLTPDAWDRVGDLLDQPIRQRESDLVPSPLLAAPLNSALTGLEDLEADEPAPPRMVRVLGPIRIDGAPPPDREVGDLIAYLAAHRDGATTATLEAQLGSSPLGSVVDAARDVLGCDAAGQPLLTVDGDGRHRLADSVGSDLGRFRLLTDQIDHATPADQARRMQEALTLVEGPPFCANGPWAHAEGLVTATTALICDVAHRLAVLVLTFGELNRAAWAVDQGLRANPECELLYRDRMRIADARGDHTALDAIMHDLRKCVEADGGWISPETLQLYERLKRSSTITAAPSEETDDRRHAS